jgi:transcription antitermination protein NusB
VLLYQQDLLKLGVQAALERAREQTFEGYAGQIVKGVEADRAAIDSLLGEHLSGWSLERLGVLERSILRVAVYELLRETEVPIAVVVDEAVNLAKRYCSGEAGALVNGILGSVAPLARAQETPGGGGTEGPK